MRSPEITGGWKETWPGGEGGYPEVSYEEAQERGKFMKAASKILMTADAGVLQVTGLVGLRRGVADADMVDMSKHLEALVFGWNQA